MKPATKKMDAKVWKLWKEGKAPKDIKTQLDLSSTGVVYNALHRERRRRGVPIRNGIGRPKKDAKKQKNRHARPRR